MHRKVWIKLYTLGALIVTTGASVTGRVGGSVTIACTVIGPEVNSIQWMKYINDVPVSITIDGLKYSGGSVSTKALTIHSLTNNDAFQYQCTASNPGGVYSSVDKTTVTVKCAWIYHYDLSILYKDNKLYRDSDNCQKGSRRLALIINTSRICCFTIFFTN